VEWHLSAPSRYCCRDRDGVSVILQEYVFPEERMLARQLVLVSGRRHSVGLFGFLLLEKMLQLFWGDEIG
jgi:hypothetical protein